MGVVGQNVSDFIEYPTNISLASNDMIPQNWNETFLNHFILIMDGYGVVFLALCGTILNILGICFTLINKTRGHSVFNILVFLLLVFDTLFILCEATISIDEYLLPFPKEYIWYYVYMVYPIERFSMTASIFMTIALAHHRFLGVTRPIYQRDVPAASRRGLCQIIQYLCLVTASATIANCPVFWEYEVHTNSETSTPYLEASTLRKNRIFILVYVNLFRLLFLGIIPLSSLMFLNYKIATATDITILPTYDPHGVIRRRMHRERNTTKLLVSITVTLIICHIPMVSLNCLELSIIKEFDSIPIYFTVVTIISRLLLIANSMFNALFYLC